MIINAHINLLARSNYAGRSGKTFFTRSLQKRPWRALTWIHAFLLFSNMNQRVLYAFFTARANGAYYLDSHICVSGSLSVAPINLDSPIASTYNVKSTGTLRVLYRSRSWRTLPDSRIYSFWLTFMARINLDSRISSISNFNQQVLYAFFTVCAFLTVRDHGAHYPCSRSWANLRHFCVQF